MTMDRVERKRAKVLGVLRDVDRWRAQGGLQVEQVMTPDPQYIPTSSSVLDVVKLFHANGHRHLLVTDCDCDTRLVGVISDRDVLRCFGPDKYPEPDRLAQISASEIMSTDLITISPEAPLHVAVTMTVEHGISCLPVLADKMLVGILTDTDLQLLLERLLPMLRESPASTSTPLAV